jgi:probable F420-dependent oxidoreductase
MKFGIHLPQIGEHVTTEMVGQAARDAEDLGFDSIWVNDHLAVPADAPYPPPTILEPMITLTWAAACTTRIVLGTSVLLLPLRHPVHVAKELASLDILSNGRLIVGAGVGWVEGEFAALGIPFTERGARMDESIKLIRACWQEDPMVTEAELISAETKNIRALPQPKREIPIWIGGNSKAALTRAKKMGNGWHGLATNLSIEDLKPIVADLRADTGPNFRITLRTFWDALKDDKDELKRNLDAYADMGINGIVSEPRQRDFAKRQRAVETMLELSKPWHTDD